VTVLVIARVFNCIRVLTQLYSYVVRNCTPYFGVVRFIRYRMRVVKIDTYIYIQLAGACDGWNDWCAVLLFACAHGRKAGVLVRYKRRRAVAYGGGRLRTRTDANSLRTSAESLVTLPHVVCSLD
jgi:hypothetical protein